MKSPACVGAILLATALSNALAQRPADNYPTKPIRLVMPNAPGSSIDTLGRILSAKLGEALGQQVVVDNRAGAGGLLGMEIGKNATADGYTLISASTAAMSIAPHIFKKLPYDPLNDYEFISIFAITPNVLVVNPALPSKSVKEFVDYAKAKSGQLNMASAGTGSQSHLSGTAFMIAAGFDALHVPYKGGGPSVASVVAGESQWTITPAPAVMSLVRAGRLRALGHSLTQRTASLGDMPTIKETVPNFDYSGWNGLLAPKGTPKAILEKLRNVLVKTVGSQDLKEQFAAQGAEIVTNTPEEFRSFLQREIASTGKVVKVAGLKAE